MLSAILEVILPVVIVATVGAVLARRFTLDGDTVGKITLYALVPPLAFHSLLTTTVSARDSLFLGIAYLAVSLVAALIALALSWRLPGGTRAGVVASVILGNNGNFGLPIALLALGREGLDQAVVIFVYSMVVMFTVGPALLGSTGGLRGAALSVARLPVTWAMLAALAVRAGGWTIPVGLSRGIELLSDACVPMVLLALGIQLGSSARLHLTRPVLLAVGLRVLVVPLLSWGIGLALGMSGIVLQSLVLAFTMPTAVNTFMLAREYGSDPDTTASTVALTTLLSIGTLAFVLAHLDAFA